MASQLQLLDLPHEMLLDVAEALTPQNTMVLTVARDHQGWKKDMNDHVYLVLKHSERDIVTLLKVFKVVNTAIMRVVYAKYPVTIPELDLGRVSKYLETTTYPAKALAKHFNLELDSHHHGPKIDKPNVVPGGPPFHFNYLHTRLLPGFLTGFVSRFDNLKSITISHAVNKDKALVTNGKKVDDAIIEAFGPTFSTYSQRYAVTTTATDDRISYKIALP
jgi:hypothetical protein